MNSRPQPTPYKPSAKEILDNAVANMAMEGFVLTPAEIASVRATVERERERRPYAKPEQADPAN